MYRSTWVCDVGVHEFLLPSERFAPAILHGMEQGLLYAIDTASTNLGIALTVATGHSTLLTNMTGK
jgi:hypothetical protein